MPSPSALHQNKHGDWDNCSPSLLDPLVGPIVQFCRLASPRTLREPHRLLETTPHLPVEFQVIHSNRTISSSERECSSQVCCLFPDTSTQSLSYLLLSSTCQTHDGCPVYRQAGNEEFHYVMTKAQEEEIRESYLLDILRHYSKVRAPHRLLTAPAIRNHDSLVSLCPNINCHC